MDCCPRLQRLFLSYNEISSASNMKNVNLVSNIQELTLDNNPIAKEKTYRRNVVANFANLKKLDSKRVTVCKKTKHTEPFILILLLSK